MSDRTIIPDCDHDYIEGEKEGEKSTREVQLISSGANAVKCVSADIPNR